MIRSAIGEFTDGARDGTRVVIVEVEPDDPDGRTVRRTLTPDEARTVGRQLIALADEADNPEPLAEA